MHCKIPSVALFSLCIAGLVITGCVKRSGSPSGVGRTTIPECGFSMNLSAGWTTEDYAETEFYRRGDRDNCWGMAKFCPLGTFNRQFSTVAEFANYVIKEDRFEGSLAEVISQRPLKVGEVQADAYEVIFKDTQGKYDYTVFIQMENREALQVFFQVNESQHGSFNKQYPSLMQSIHLTRTKYN